MSYFKQTTGLAPARPSDLAADVPVGEADDQPVLGGVVLVLVLNNQALASIKVRFPLWSSREKRMSL